MLNECKQQEKASDDDVLQFMNHKIPQGPNAKCFLACVHEKTGIVSKSFELLIIICNANDICVHFFISKKIKGGKVNVDILKAPPMKDGDTVKPASPTSEQALKECVALNHPDRCELSSKLAECLNKAFSGNGNGNDIKKN